MKWFKKTKYYPDGTGRVWKPACDETAHRLHREPSLIDEVVKQIRAVENTGSNSK
jgi:hypothetical protein